MPSVDKQKLMAWAVNYTDYEELKRRATEAFTGWDAKDPAVFFHKTRLILDVLEDVIDLVERFSRDVDKLSGKDKLDSAVDFLDDIVKFPFFLEWVDQVIIKYLLTMVVTQKNKHFGQKWFDSVVDTDIAENGN